MSYLRAAVIALLGTSTATGQGPSQLKCNIGPVTKTYGGSKWLVYSCDDNRSLIIVSAPGNPATPFYFTVRPGANGFDIHGEGTGDKKFTAAASKELTALKESDIAGLISAARKSTSK